MRSSNRRIRYTPRRLATRVTAPSAGEAVTQASAGRSAKRTSTLGQRPRSLTLTSYRSSTVTSVRVQASRSTRDNATIGHTMPMTNRANANTPTATTLCSPDAAPAATP